MYKWNQSQMVFHEKKSDYIVTILIEIVYYIYQIDYTIKQVYFHILLHHFRWDLMAGIFFSTEAIIPISRDPA